MRQVKRSVLYQLFAGLLGATSKLIYAPTLLLFA